MRSNRSAVTANDDECVVVEIVSESFVLQRRVLYLLLRIIELINHDWNLLMPASFLRSISGASSYFVFDLFILLILASLFIHRWI